ARFHRAPFHIKFPLQQQKWRRGGFQSKERTVMQESRLVFPERAAQTIRHPRVFVIKTVSLDRGARTLQRHVTRRCSEWRDRQIRKARVGRNGLEAMSQSLQRQ